MSENTPETELVHLERPPGEYAIVEVLGHQTLVGRISEVERFGQKLLGIEVIFDDKLLPAALHGGAAIYRLTPMSADEAFRQQPKREYLLPPAIRTLLTQPALPQTLREVIDGCLNAADDDDLPF